MSTISSPFFISRWATSFSCPLGGNFKSSTTPFILISVAGSYLGGWVCAADTPTHKKIAMIGSRKTLPSHTAAEALKRRMALLLAVGTRETGLTRGSRSFVPPYGLLGLSRPGLGQ